MDSIQTKSKLIELINARDKVQALANTLAGDENGHLAAALQQSKNIISRVIHQLDGTDTPCKRMLPLVVISEKDLEMIQMVDLLR